jgi:APA family basic amino acid/polyamine antiporter
MNLFRTKNLAETIDNAEHSSLKKSLGAVDLILLGIGCTIGTGIFVLTGIGAAKYAGPAISLSYLFSAFACAFAALAYAELASMVPASGSAYTYTYVVIGEFVAWLVGWGLILEYGVGAATVASGWSGYMIGILNAGGVHLPEYLTKTPIGLILCLLVFMEFSWERQQYFSLISALTQLQQRPRSAKILKEICQSELLDH